MRTYRIDKIYQGQESKNKIGYETGIQEQDVQFRLDVHESTWKKHGGLVVERGDDFVTVEEDNGEVRITFQAIED